MFITIINIPPCYYEINPSKYSICFQSKSFLGIFNLLNIFGWENKGFRFVIIFFLFYSEYGMYLVRDLINLNWVILLKDLYIRFASLFYIFYIFILLYLFNKLLIFLI